jgi:hypothetical protein
MTAGAREGRPYDGQGRTAVRPYTIRLSVSYPCLPAGRRCQTARATPRHVGERPPGAT